MKRVEHLSLTTNKLSRDNFFASFEIFSRQPTCKTQQPAAKAKKLCNKSPWLSATLQMVPKKCFPRDILALFPLNARHKTLRINLRRVSQLSLLYKEGGTGPSSGQCWILRQKCDKFGLGRICKQWLHWCNSNQKWTFWQDILLLKALNVQHNYNQSAKDSCKCFSWTQY